METKFLATWRTMTSGRTVHHDDLVEEALA